MCIESFGLSKRGSRCDGTTYMQPLVGVTCRERLCTLSGKSARCSTGDAHRDQRHPDSNTCRLALRRVTLIIIVISVGFPKLATSGTSPERPRKDSKI